MNTDIQITETYMICCDGSKKTIVSVYPSGIHMSQNEEENTEDRTLTSFSSLNEAILETLTMMQEHLLLKMNGYYLTNGKESQKEEDTVKVSVSATTEKVSDTERNIKLTISTSLTQD